MVNLSLKSEAWKGQRILDISGNYTYLPDILEVRLEEMCCDLIEANRPRDELLGE